MRYSTATNTWIDTGETLMNVYVYVTGLSKNYFFDGNGWYKLPEIVSYTALGGGVVRVRANGLQGTFVQFYVSINGGATYAATGSPMWVSQAKTTGVSYTSPLAPGSDLYFKAKCYTHNCDYGTSDAYKITI